ncbi:hypothetical protein ACSBR1_041508 [Camellia fascicularis]
MVAALPPGPRGVPILGSIPFFGTNRHKSFSELAHRYGPIYKLWLGKKLCVVITSPSLAKQVVCDQDTVLSNREAPIAALVASYSGIDIVWSPSGPHWRNMLKIFVREMLKFNAVLSMLWGSTFDSQKGSTTSGGLVAKFRAGTGKIMEILGKPNVSEFFPVLARFDFQGLERDIKVVLVDVERIFDSVIDARVKMGTGDSDEAVGEE